MKAYRLANCVVAYFFFLCASVVFAGPKVGYFYVPVQTSDNYFLDEDGINAALVHLGVPLDPQGYASQVTPQYQYHVGAMVVQHSDNVISIDNQYDRVPINVFLSDCTTSDCYAEIRNRIGSYSNPGNCSSNRDHAQAWLCRMDAAANEVASISGIENKEVILYGHFGGSPEHVVSDFSDDRHFGGRYPDAFYSPYNPYLAFAGPLARRHRMVQVWAPSFRSPSLQAAYVRMAKFQLQHFSRQVNGIQLHVNVYVPFREVNDFKQSYKAKFLAPKGVIDPPASSKGLYDPDSSNSAQNAIATNAANYEWDGLVETYDKIVGALQGMSVAVAPSWQLDYMLTTWGAYSCTPSFNTDDSIYICDDDLREILRFYRINESHQVVFPILLSHYIKNAAYKIIKEADGADCAGLTFQQLAINHCALKKFVDSDYLKRFLVRLHTGINNVPSVPCKPDGSNASACALATAYIPGSSDVSAARPSRLIIAENGWPGWLEDDTQPSGYRRDFSDASFLDDYELAMLAYYRYLVQAGNDSPYLFDALISTFYSSPDVPLLNADGTVTPVIALNGGVHLSHANSYRPTMAALFLRNQVFPASPSIGISSVDDSNMRVLGSYISGQADQYVYTNCTGSGLTNLICAFDNGGNASVSNVVGNALVVGYAEKFDRIYFKNVASTHAGIGGNVTWEYWNGSAWVSLSNVVDHTNKFNALATYSSNTVSFSIPSNWVSRTIGSSTSYYYVRARLTATYTTALPVMDVHIGNMYGFNVNSIVNCPYSDQPTSCVR